jgi:3-oxoacyl-[acyl-carrier protein] reductase
MAREAARQFVKQRSGNLVNISSTAGTRGFQGGTAYASSKFALRGMNECWREELRRHNVRVILVNPSEVLTGFGGAPPRESEKKLRPQEVADAIVGALKVDDRGFLPEFSIFATNPF